VRKIPPFLKLFLIMYLIPGLDFRFSCSAVPVWLVITSNIIVCSGYIFIIIVFNENSYASSVIKLENEQRVISTGPYAVIRHPMYTGMLLMTLFTPLALGSCWAFIPCILFIPWLYLRIKNEEEMLVNKLPGYREYCEKIKYRLFPFIW
jgi:protein-S-isoprenylcysteine O-methyltransferase Ste14